MSIKDNSTHYGSLSRINHWLAAAILIGMLAVGLYFNDMPRGEEKFYWLKLHISVGGLVFIYLLFRVLWRLFCRSPDPVQQSKSLQLATQIVHWVLLLSILTMAISGPMLVWTRGSEINVFTWFAIPSPISEMPVLHEWMETIHAIAAKVLLAAISIHVLAVIKHQFIDQDQVLSRMVKFMRK